MQIHPLCASATFESELALRAFDQDATHRLRRRRQEMSAVLPRRLLVAAKAKPGLMHQRSRLQSLAWRFPGHFRRREFAQFIVNEREQFVSSFGVALLDAIQNSRDIAQASNDIRGSADLHALKWWTSANQGDSTQMGQEFGAVTSRSPA